MDERDIAGLMWRQTVIAIFSYAIVFRDNRLNISTDASVVKELVHQLAVECHDRVRGNRGIDVCMSASDQALVFEAVLQKALEVMEVPVV